MSCLSSHRTILCCLLLWAAAPCTSRGAAPELGMDFTRAVIVTPPGLSGPEKKAVAMLADEVEKRTQIRWKQSDTWPTEAVSVVAVGQGMALQSLTTPAGIKFN